MPPELTDKLLEWEQKRREGTPVSPEELCADTPEIVEEFRRQIRRLAECDRLLGLDDTPFGATEPDAQIPEKIAGFEVRGRLGRGGMGDVYDVWDPTLRREVAIKVLRLPVDFFPFVRTSELIGRFSREGAVLARLEHPNIVPVHQAGVWDGRPYIVMAKIGGGTLAAHRADFAAKPPRDVAAFMEKVAHAVHAAHCQGVLHRDLKPGNILVAADGEPRVADFGLAKLWLADEPTESSNQSSTNDSHELTAAGTQPGTPSYMAPEQLDPSRGPTGPATDVWALGVILHELLTGKRPFTGKTRRELVENVCHSPTPSARANRRQVPQWLDSIVARCLAKATVERYASAADLASALRTGLRRRPRMIWIGSALAVLALVLASGFAIGKWRLRERPFEEHPEVVAALDQLSKSEEVVFVDKDRKRPFRSVFGKEILHDVSDDSELLKLYTRWKGTSMAEFLPRLPPGRYRVRTVLRHDLGDEHTKVALYMGGHFWESAQGQHLACVWMQYADVGPHLAEPLKDGRLTNSRATLDCLLTGQVAKSPSHWSADPFGGVDFLAAGRNPDFRTVEFLVSETAIEAWWDGHRVGSVSVQDADAKFAMWRQQYPPLSTTADDPHPFRGSVGLMVYNGKLSVKDFRITPQN